MWRFCKVSSKTMEHGERGESFTLCNYVDGIVMSQEPLEINKLYEIHVDETNGGNVFAMGVVMDNPENLDQQSYNVWMQSAIVMFRDGISVRRNTTTSRNSQALKRVKVGSRVGVLIDSARCLHLYVDGIDQGVVYRGLPQDCYAVFDLFPDLRKISTLPVTAVLCDSTDIF